MFAELNLEDNLKIDSLCDAFESEWTPENSLIFKPYLDRCAPHLHRGAVQELIKVDLELRFSNGLEIAPELYQNQLPEFSDVIQEVVESSKVELNTLLFPQQTSEKDQHIHEAKPNASMENTKEHFGRFEILEALGKGAFGTVYLAYDPMLDRKVALKLAHSQNFDQERIDRFLDEAQIAAQLHHPNIVVIWERGEIDQQFYISSAFVEGDTLAQKLSGKNIKTERIVSWIQDLAQALHYAHEEHIIHRDIKPANIMINEHQRPMIMDFGLAKRINNSPNRTTDGLILGTPTYMSPEQARGNQSEMGPQTDQYSLGSVFYEMLTGKPLYSGSVHKILITLQGNPAPPGFSTVKERIPVDLISICQKMLQPSVADRYVNCGVVAKDLNNWLENRPVSARRVSTSERFRKWCSRNKVLSGSIASVAIILVTSLIAISFALMDSYLAQNEAQTNLNLAVQNEQLAVKNEQQAKQERDNAEKAAIVARKESSRNQILLAAKEIQEGRFQEAMAMLNATSKEDRNWIWRIQLGRVPREACRFSLNSDTRNSSVPIVSFDHQGKKFAVPFYSTSNVSPYVTRIVNIETQKLISTLPLKWSAVLSSFTRDGRYLLVYKPIKRGNWYFKELGVYDTQKKTIIATHPEVLHFEILRDCEHKILLEKKMDDQPRFSIWDFRNNKSEDLGTGPFCFPGNFSLAPDKKSLAFRTRNKVTFSTKETREEKTQRSVMKRLGAIHSNASDDFKYIVGQLQDTWNWEERGRIIAPGQVAVVQLPDKIISKLESNSAVAEDLLVYSDKQSNISPGKWQGFRISNDNQYVTLNLNTTGSPICFSTSLCWWNMKSGEFIGKAQGVSISPQGNLYANVEYNEVVIRKAPLHVRRFRSQFVEKELARWEPITHYGPQVRPYLFYYQEEPWVIVPHRGGNDKVNLKKRVIETRPVNPKFHFHQIFTVVDHRQGRIAFMVDDDFIEIFSLKTGEKMARLPCDKKQANGLIAFHPDGQHFIGAGRQGIVQWSIDDEKIVKRNTSVRGYSRKLDIDPTGQHLCLITRKGINMINLDDFTLKWTTKTPHNFKVSFSHDGKLIATGSNAGSVRVFSAETGALVQEIPTGNLRVSAIFHPQESTLFVGRAYGRLVAYDCQTWKIVFDEQLEGAVDEFRFSESGESLAVGTDVGWTRRWFEFSSKR
ncbi:WD40 repeat domain-containing serine/threonine protein kinase [Gimesia aquarii]|uniref:Serine/threonine-protein kinase PknB n=1 Tax=Gimesia aquarii TaxID=2527964 RepID=A0A517VSB5_9PLAN|nr:WD40 repeat domain-containing serine/threonine protein kinase [Gimesia aquarii]QDT95906.1 Serine/threonine-protein kinase PknB [Gimesia aquarii]